MLAAVVAGAAGVAHGADDGRDVFMRYCALCHGEAADGGGQMARLLDPSPSNLRASRLDRGQRERIVRQGGASVSRSASMPAWEAELSRAQLRAVLLYLEQIRAPASAAQ